MIFFKMLSKMLIYNFKPPYYNLNFFYWVNPSFNRLFSVKPLTQVAPSNESLSYRFYDSPLFQPIFKQTFVNICKPVFINQVNMFGDLPNVLIKDSKWFCYWKKFINYWQKRRFLFISRDLSDLKLLGLGVINLRKYLELPLGISYSAFWWSFLILGFPTSDYIWLKIFADVNNKLTDVVIKKMFKTTEIHILIFQPVSSVKSEYYIIVRTDLKELNFCLYGFKCALADKLSLQTGVTIFRDSKKKWVYLKPEVEDFVYYVHTENKRRVYYQHVDCVIKKISKVKFESLKLRLPVKKKNKKCYENVSS